MQDQDVAAAVHQSGCQLVLGITGGGLGLLSTLLTVPGASRTILEVVVPYSAASLTDWLKREPEQFCSERTALAMASVACQRARQLAPQERDRCVGLGITAALVSERPKRGEHRAHLAIQTSDATWVAELVLDKGRRTRPEEDALVGAAGLDLLVQALGLQQRPDVAIVPEDRWQTSTVSAQPWLAEVWDGTRSLVWSLPEGHWSEQLPDQPRGLLCGAFDPLHAGHEQLRKVAEQRLGTPVAYEISIANVDKPPLDFLTIERRRTQFRDVPLALTNAATFVRKAAIFPGVSFVVGSDTAERIVAPRYYGNDPDAMLQALASIRQQGCHFLVAGRLQGDAWHALHDIPLPAGFEDLFTEIPESEFRVDLSSTELRHRQADLEG